MTRHGRSLLNKMLVCACGAEMSWGSQRCLACNKALRRSITDATRARFMARVEPAPTGCLMWTGPRHQGSSPYGQFSIAGKLVPTNRAAWLLFRGPIPDGLYVLHDCDTYGCVNLDHLHLGTQADNMHELVTRQGHWRHRATVRLPAGVAP